MASFADSVLSYYRNIEPPNKLPKDVEVMNPYKHPETFEVASKFYQKYYHDENPRFICFGINPGRFGAGVTGVPFTDPIQLEVHCQIKNELEKKPELSSRFIYEMIHAFGGPQDFYAKFYISAVSPLGYVRNGINLNYYDIKNYKVLFESYAVTQIKKQLRFGISTETAFSIGKGENIKFLNWLNNKHQFFQEIIPLPHPRWVMQYRLRRKDIFIKEYVDALNGVL